MLKVPVHSLLEESLGMVLGSLPEWNSGGISGRHEVGEWLVGEGQLAPLKNHGKFGLFLDCFELILKRLDVHLSLICVLQPVDREEVSKTSTEADTLYLIIWATTVGTP